MNYSRIIMSWYFKKQLSKAILLTLLICMVPNSLAADVIVSPPNTTIQIGQTFNININIDPLIMPVSGAQLNIKYNQSVLTVNKVIEGNFFKQEGAKTYFNSGILNNSTGIDANIFSVILGKSNVSRSGTFLIINATAIGSANLSWINISDVKISNPEGISVSIKSKNGTLNISKMNGTYEQYSEKIPPASIGNLREALDNTSFTLKTGGSTRTMDVIGNLNEGYINGTVRNKGTVISGVLVATNASVPITTDASGFYSIRIPAGSHNIIATRYPAFYQNSSILVLATSGSTVMQDIELKIKPLGTISGSVIRNIND
jgi:hypothetical protein